MKDGKKKRKPADLVAIIKSITGKALTQSQEKKLRRKRKRISSRDENDFSEVKGA